MIVTRPCSCDRFAPGRPFRPKKDCSKCWLYAHRPAVRRAWGGDPAECLNHLLASPEMPVEALAELLAEEPYALPGGWRHWPVAREAHLLLVERFLAAMPEYPAGRFRGRGAVICGGGRYEASAYVACRMLRLVGWEHPIQVWHRGDEEPVSARVRGLPGVEVVDIEAHPARPSRRIIGGWESKTFAIINSPFEEVLYLDADAYPVFNPEECFTPENNPKGIVVWPDMPLGKWNLQWHSYGLESDKGPGISGGCYVLTKRRAWSVLQLAQHYDDHSDYYYRPPNASQDGVGGFGDQDQMRAALRRLNFRPHLYEQEPDFDPDCYIHGGPHGRPLFVHRYGNKFAAPGAFDGPPKWRPERFPMEATAWQFFLEWMKMPCDDPSFPDEIPGWFTRAECGLWRRVCRNRDVLELGRYHGRSTVVAAAVARSVVSIDRLSAAPADHWLQQFGLRHKVWLRQGDFAELAPNCGCRFSACLIDGDHQGPAVERDIESAVPLMGSGAVIAFHDYADAKHPEVKPAVDAAASRYGWRLLEQADHLAVFEIPGG